MRKKCNVTMLPTDRAGVILQGVKVGEYNPPLILSKDKDEEWEKFGTYQHLYFTLSSVQEDSVNGEEIRDGDWIITPFGLQQYEFHQGTALNQLLEKEYRKVIATTDESLWYNGLTAREYRIEQGSWIPNIPKIPLDFVERFVKEQGRIKQVMVDYEYGFKNDSNTNAEVELKPILNNNGSVKVYPVEDRKYSLDEMLDNMQYYLEYYHMHGYVTPQDWLTKHKHF